MNMRASIGLATLAAVAALSACGFSGAPTTVDQWREMTDDQVSDYLDTNAASDEAEYVEFMLSEGAGLNPPAGVTERDLVIFAHEECADLSPSPPPEWQREGAGEPGFDNFVHTARGFAHRMICPA